jgi:hypothetical protein
MFTTSRQRYPVKLDSSKCCFIRQEVEYLGLLVTPQGNGSLVEAVTQFPRR